MLILTVFRIPELLSCCVLLLINKKQMNDVQLTGIGTFLMASQAPLLALNSISWHFYASLSSVDANSDRELTPNFEL